VPPPRAEAKATPLVDTPNTILRRVLGLEPKGTPTPEVDVQGELLPLLEGGRLKAGDELTWNRPRKKETHRAVVTAGGCLKLSDGHVEATPSAACSHAAGGGNFNGWIEWHTADGTPISDLRK
jgi:Restriction Enzyme Adenine Methylase Associated